MKTESLEAFLRTAELKSLTRASELLHISQPALSKQIRSLEDELATQLLIRSTSGVSLTTSGQILYERSKRIMEEVGALKREIAFNDGTKVQLNIGSWPSIATAYLPSRIARNKQQDNLSEYKIRVSYSYYDLLKNLENGSIDAALFDDRGITHSFCSSPVFTEVFLLYVNRSHPSFGARDEVTFKEIKDEAFVMLPEGCDIRMLVENEFVERGAKLQISFEIELGQSILGFIQSNLGIAILPEIFVSQAGSEVKAIPISDFNSVRQISLLTREDAVNRVLLALFQTN
ncbi:LysR family transcriptional regulator [Paenibacillus albus]|uniref:LysR family transcriptional regulator n=1 Tax=Paenibacillus albus TaxID=2495582 RepID=A0A3Q8X568_9BACL|nr:LysR family transcriptional regulator [Paenibacillus albus]AZN40798.1 LysR family transcriptional regulator [Paenibacillus albus]